MTVHTLARRRAGSGALLGTYLAWGVNNNGWWGEGEIKFYLDGDADWPTICGTGTEDYFGGCLELRAPEGSVRRLLRPIQRAATGDQPGRAVPGQQRFGMYRWHVMDPIRFRQDLRVTIQALGWRSTLRVAALSAAAGRHRLDRLLVPGGAARGFPEAAGPERAGGDLRLLNDGV